jgi:NAD-dependent DNA ligase
MAPLKNLSKTVIAEIKHDPVKYASSVTIDELVITLKKLSDVYYNTGKSAISDDIYDKMRDVLKSRDADNPYLKYIGAPVKGTKNKVELPYPMGSLDKIKPDTNALAKWLQTYNGPYVLSDKMDGGSAQIYKNKEGKLFMYSRGDGKVGQDISHLIGFIANKIDFDKIPNGCSIRGELIIEKDDFKQISDKMENARNAVAGLINSKTVNIHVASITQFVAYAILHPSYTQADQMKLLKEYGFTVTPYKIVKTLTEKDLIKYLTERRTKSTFDIDGIVCVDSSKKYNHKAGYPEHAFAFKMVMNEQISDATVVKVIWDPSMDGYLKPTIEIIPIKLVGTTIRYATAFNAKFVVDNQIGPGSQIKIIRSGDVIPYIMEVVKGSTNGKPQMPDIKYHWTETNVDIIIDDFETNTNDTVKVKQLVYFFKTMNVKYLSEGIITKLVDNGYDTVIKILKAKESKLTKIEGLGDKMVTKIYDEINKAFETVELHTFMSASHKFGRGLAEKKLIQIVNAYPYILTQDWDDDEMIDNIMELDGFSTKTSELFTKNYKKFYKFYKDVNKVKDISRFEINESDCETDSSDDEDQLFSGKSLVFTGFRDKELEKFIIKNGGKVSTSVSKNTHMVIYADSDAGSSKLIKAKELNIKSMNKTQFMKKYMD